MADAEAPGAGAPIIFKKIKKGGHGHHGGAWKVAYADMVTAMLALFIVLWILAQSPEVIAAVAGYFRDPVGFTEGGLSSPIEGGAASNQIQILPDASRANAGDSEEDLDLEQEERWREAARNVRNALEQIPEFTKYKDQIEMSITPEGLRISLVESPNPIFEVGGIKMNFETEALLMKIAEQIGRLPNPIVIEGHTDSRPYVGPLQSNWELSSGRANTARKVLETAGLAPKRIIEVRGFADRQLYNPVDPSDSRNRRVSITLLSEQAYAARQKALTEKPAE